MSDDYVAIQKLRHPTSGKTIYMPEGQALPDTVQTLERDGLIVCQHDGRGDTYTVHDPRNVRVICWMLTINADARRRGRGDVFTNLPADLIDHAVQ